MVSFCPLMLSVRFVLHSGCGVGWMGYLVLGICGIWRGVGLSFFFFFFFFCLLYGRSGGMD
ncbi:hypothetical protein I7I48_03321 [Histoplasma ohiense]|nr:hypothetical protein I7I48_03321 [Histoplasma ohiense (nom. inval.)]